MIDLKDINERIIDRKNSFFWQTDRKITQEETREIWEDKHRGITTLELLESVNKVMDNKVKFIKDVNEDDQTNLGFINSVRVGVLNDGREVIIRCHPKGVKNGYFHAESLVSSLLKKSGLPAYYTFAIHDLVNEDDVSFQVIEKLEGTAMKKWFEENPQDIDKLMVDAGKTLAKIHSIKVKGFGSFDNELAKQGELVGLHDSFEKFIMSGLEDNLDVLVMYNHINEQQKNNIISLYKDNALLKCDQAVLVHNDYADWNLLTDGEKVSGILDLDECCASDPLCDIACWMSMAPQNRVSKFLDGYYGDKEKPANFEEKVNLFTLRYVISNMVQRSYRSEYIHTEFLNDLLKQGKQQIVDLLKYFNID